MNSSEMTTEYLCVDDDCSICGTTARERTCDDCGAVAIVTDCGHQVQPRPIAAGRTDGRQMHRDYCTDCAEQYRAACVGSSRLTGREHAHLSDDELIAEALEESRRHGLGLTAEDITIDWWQD